MNILKNNKGFTLFELLAVIVILSVVMGIATFVALPLIDSSRESGFAATANFVVEAVRNKSLSDDITGSSKTCYTLKELIEENYVDRISLPKPEGATNNGYEGVVLVDKATNSYTIHLIDYANDYKIIKDVTENGEVIGDDLVTYRDETPLTTCP